jgi:predicted lipoprotein with Yx(FWY)xxD motif
MSSAQQEQIARSSRRRRPSGLLMGSLAAMLVLAGSLAAIALASGGAPTISSASSSALGKQIVVDAHGRTLYALSPETTHHLLCKSSECERFWPPLTVHSSKTKLAAGPGVHGRLAILRRSKGVLQVTLGGLPVYRYSGDHAKGEANGQGIHSFGGSWHVLSATGDTNPTTSTTTPSTPTTPGPTTTTPTIPTPAPTPTTPTTTTPTPTTPSPAPEYKYSY